jgi:AcrR family transcriptional regulator
MTPDERREMIVRSALPLVAEFGAAVTTAKIARAAGIGEATIFRAFTDKEELLAACVTEALRADHVFAEIDAIPADQPLAERLTQAIEAMQAHMARIGSVLGAMQTSGHRPERPANDTRGEMLNRSRELIAELMEPDRDLLRIPVDRAASTFLSLVFALARPAPGATAPTAAETVDLFLYGMVTRPGEAA